MNTYSTRARGALKAALAVAVAAGLTVAAAPAQAKPPVRLGPVSNLAATATHTSGAYVVSCTWDALSGATSYKVALTSGSTTIASTSVKATHWSAPTTLAAATIVKVTVTPVATKAGRASSVSVVLPDVTPPTGTFTVNHTSPSADVSVTQNSLSDDVSPNSGISKVIDWGDGSPTFAWASGDPSYTYPGGKKVYYPTVTLTDQAHNAAVVALHAVAVGDTTPPTGAFSVAQTSAWATYTPVSLTQDSLTDDLSLPAKITRVVTWGDGTSTSVPAGTALTHVYTLPGTYNPTVRITDEGDNFADVAATGSVTVTADTVKPVASVKRPAGHRTWVRSWVTLRGGSSDTATSGVRRVQVQVVEKRGAAWYAYKASTRRWVKAGTTKGAALRKAVAAQVPTTGAWSYRVRGLRLGTLVVRANAVDNVGNVSGWATRSQRLTHS